ncbi:MAG: hypothetical protein OFPII_19400 [Osedax symbiont Rs1]|nr:MAG: hypothetical protein OFPII_19400 [Osedax symbiont Rs1]
MSTAIPLSGRTSLETLWLKSVINVRRDGGCRLISTRFICQTLSPVK